MQACAADTSPFFTQARTPVSRCRLLVMLTPAHDLPTFGPSLHCARTRTVFGHSVVHFAKPLLATAYRPLITHSSLFAPA
eukprot:2678146-Alexandrium_andersonii.AAC.1